LGEFDAADFGGYGYHAQLDVPCFDAQLGGDGAELGEALGQDGEALLALEGGH